MNSTRRRKLNTSEKSKLTDIQKTGDSKERKFTYRYKSNILEKINEIKNNHNITAISKVLNHALLNFTENENIINSQKEEIEKLKTELGVHERWFLRKDELDKDFKKLMLIQNKKDHSIF